MEADARRFKVTYAQDCDFIYDYPQAMSKVCVVCGAAVEELSAVSTRACEAAVICGAGHCVCTLAADMLSTTCVWGE